MTNLVNQKHTTWHMKRLIILKLDSDSSGIGFSNMQLIIIFSKSSSKHTQMGAFISTLNNKLNKNYTLVVFIAFTERVGFLNPISKKGSKNNKVDIGDSVYIPQVRVQTPT